MFGYAENLFLLSIEEGSSLATVGTPLANSGNSQRYCTNLHFSSCVCLCLYISFGLQCRQSFRLPCFVVAYNMVECFVRWLCIQTVSGFLLTPPVLLYSLVQVLVQPVDSLGFAFSYCDCLRTRKACIAVLGLFRRWGFDQTTEFSFVDWLSCSH